MQVTDYFLTKEKFDISEVLPGVLKTTPVPENLEKYYQSEDYISHHQQKKTFRNIIYKSVQKLNLAYKKKILNEFLSKNASILDYGCGVGDFLEYIKNDYSVRGIEPNQQALEIVKTKIGEENVLRSLDEIPSNSFDAISLWHVFEHISNPKEFSTEILQKLKPKGKLIIAVPNFQSDDAKYYKEFWAAYDVPRHLFHFSKEGIKSIFSNNNTKLIKIKPLYFDSIYISILSEKYKNNRLFWLRGLVRGMISNFKALKSQEYSSMIYIIEKLK